LGNIFSKSIMIYTNRKIQSRLLSLSRIFLFFYALALTLAPALRERTWQVDYSWSHWLGFSVWGIITLVADRQLQKYLPDSDPFLFPIAALLSGWGIMTIWRLVPDFGLRQSIWMLGIGCVFIFCLRLPENLNFLRNYKYLWLVSGLLITTLTLLFGVNPLGGGPRLWLGCCGIYFQPSEPLKLFLVIYLAAYFADRVPLKISILPALVPTIFVTGIALAILIIQRDLGTASIFIFLYTIQLYIASGKKRVLLISLVGLCISALLGYFLFDVVRLRMDAWLNPWLDPSGRSYQIVQSLLAFANGGLFGRGPGGGSPGLVPVAISDFIFSAIAEEFGLVGTFGLLALIGIFTFRGIRIALHAPDRFRRSLAVGLTSYLIAQSLLIIGGNLRVLPLTGVTLPFVSYGGSSLLASFFALLLLLLISNHPDTEPLTIFKPQPFYLLTAFFVLGLVVISLANGWWAVWRGPDLLSRSDNARRSISDLYVKRGSILARQDQSITVTEGISGSFNRVYLFPELSPITGYTNPIYGQAGLEYSLDDYLRGLQGNNFSLIWWDHLLYGQPPPGLDIRLSINLDLQDQADSLMGGLTGAIILMNATSGEILVMASHPNYDPNVLDQNGSNLSQDSRKPLINRAAQGMYLPGESLHPFLAAAGLVDNPLNDSQTNLYQALGFYTSPNLRLPVAQAISPTDDLRISPLQMALAAATLSNAGLRPPPRLAMSVKTPQQGWVILPPLSEPVQAIQPEMVANSIEELLVSQKPFWEYNSVFWDNSESRYLTWYTAGTLPDWQGTPLVVVVLLEENDPGFAEQIGLILLTNAQQQQ
jgi:cell division protein FtsW (lipid II flippase)